ncbi:MAG: hypothetical protein AAB650_00755 [Patescibacteria group bacterium]
MKAHIENERAEMVEAREHIRNKASLQYRTACGADALLIPALIFCIIVPSFAGSSNGSPDAPFVVKD